jgi:hypothetical protein
MVLLLLSFLQQARNVAWLMHLGKIDLGFDLRRSRPLPRARRAGFVCKVSPDQLRFVVFNRRRVGLLFLDSHFRQGVENFPALYFKLSGQIIDSNFHALRFLHNLSH